MKRFLSILVVMGILLGLAVVPVAADETIYSVMAKDAVLGEGTSLNEDGFAIFDEEGDSFSFDFAVDADGAYAFHFLATNTTGAAQHYGTALEIDGVRYSPNLLDDNYVPADDKLIMVGFGTVALTAGRHTARVVNMEGEYNVRSIRVNTTTAAAPTEYNWQVRWNEAEDASDVLYLGSRDHIATYMQGANGSGCKNIIATMGVPETGIYKLSWDVSHLHATKNEQQVNIWVDGQKVLSKVNANNSAAPAGYNFEKREITSNLALSAGTHTIHIENASPYNYYYAVKVVRLEKVGELTYPDVTLLTKHSTATVSPTGIAKDYDSHPVFSANGGWLEYTISVPYEGIYTPILTWTAANNSASSKTAYPRLYVDGACVWGNTIFDETEKGYPWFDGSSDGVDMESTLGDCYLSAGEHKIRIQSGGGYFRTQKLVFTHNTAADGILKAEAEGFIAEKTANLTEDFGLTGKVVIAAPGSYAHYYVNAPANGFYRVSTSFDKGVGNSNVIVQANGSRSTQTVVGNLENPKRTEQMDGMLYLKKGQNDVTLRVDNVSLILDSLTFTPVAWADRILTPIPVELYKGEVADANLTKTVAVNTNYTAVADFGGAMAGEGVSVVIALYNGNQLVNAKVIGGVCKVGTAFTHNFTTPEEAGSYHVKAFTLGALSDLKPILSVSEFAAEVVEEAPEVTPEEVA